MDRTPAQTRNTEPLVKFIGVEKSYDGHALAVRDLTLDVAQGEFLTLLGPSGSGKTTTLNMLAGFERPTRGEILLGGRPVDRLPPYERNIGMVFQNYALFPHMTVGENVAFPLSVRRMPRATIAERVSARSSAATRGPRSLLQKALGGNPKTFIIAASIALGGPVYYFLTTLVPLNLILLISIVHHKSMERRLAAAISAAEARLEERLDLLRPPIPGQLPRRSERAAPRPRRERGLTQQPVERARRPPGIARRHQQRILAVREQFRGVGRGRREDRPAGGEIGEELQRQHAIAELLERRPRRRDQQRVGGVRARRAASAGACHGTIRTLARPAASASIGPSPSDPTSTNSTSGPQVGQREELVEPLLRVHPPGIERDRPILRAARASALAVARRRHRQRIGAVMGDQDLLLGHAGAAIGAGRIMRNGG